MKKNKGFTLVELLAVIVVLGILMTVVSVGIINNINSTKEKSKYTAAKEITNIAEAYFSVNNITDDCIKVSDLKDYLEENVTNPLTGENIDSYEELENQLICKGNYEKQEGYEPVNDEYYFDGYRYSLK